MNCKQQSPLFHASNRIHINTNTHHAVASPPQLHQLAQRIYYSPQLCLGSESASSRTYCTSADRHRSSPQAPTSKPGYLHPYEHEFTTLYMRVQCMVVINGKTRLFCPEPPAERAEIVVSPISTDAGIGSRAVPSRVSLFDCHCFDCSLDNRWHEVHLTRLLLLAAECLM